MPSVDTNSAFFTSSYSGRPSPPAEVGYGQPSASSPYGAPPTRQGSHSSASGYGNYGASSSPTYGAPVTHQNTYGNPSGYGVAQQPTRPSSYSGGRKKGGGGSSMGSGLKLILLLILVVVGGYVWLTFIKIPGLRNEILHEEVGPMKAAYKDEIRDLEEVLADTKRENERLKKEKESGGGNSATMQRELNDLRSKSQTTSRDLKDAKERLSRAEREAADLKQAIQESSKLAVKQKYGDGPYQAEMELQFPGDPADKFWYVVFELAPLAEMPNTIYTFLQQISNGLFDGAGYSFHHNGPHISQAAPFPNHITKGPEWENRAKKFKASGYNSVLVQEYSNKFPHQKYTLGLTGRPSGPGIYINARDNTKLHGPGGYAKDGSGDPCFAKVIKGFDVVDRLFGAAGELKSGDWKELNGGPVAVRSIRVIRMKKD